MVLPTCDVKNAYCLFKKGVAAIFVWMEQLPHYSFKSVFNCKHCTFLHAYCKSISLIRDQRKKTGKQIAMLSIPELDKNGYTYGQTRATLQCVWSNSKTSNRERFPIQHTTIVILIWMLEGSSLLPSISCAIFYCCDQNQLHRHLPPT